MRFFTFSTVFVLSLMCFVVLGEKSETSSERDIPVCKLRTTTYGYELYPIFHLPKSSLHSRLFGGDLLFKFMVRASSDAHILLAPSSSSSIEKSQAVYEVVLGAGSNTFSVIRRGLLGVSRKYVRTKGILSPTEMRGFWIHINNDGIIRVGKDGADEAFMFWQDPEPVAVRYFSFCSWFRTTCDWIFDCIETEDPGEMYPSRRSVHVMSRNLNADISLEQRCAKEVKGHKKIKIDGARSSSDASLCKAYFEETYGGTLKKLQICPDNRHHRDISCVIFMRIYWGLNFSRNETWNDEKMRWNPEDYENITELNLKNHALWQPEIVLYNAVGHGGSPLGAASMIVTYDGNVTWRPPIHLDSRCYQDLSSWPWDTQMCYLQFGFWSEEDSLKFFLTKNGTQLALPKASSEWSVIKFEAETLNTTAPWLGDVDGISETLIFIFTLQRQGTFYCYVFILPLLGMVLLLLLGFWISPLRSEKLALRCISLLLLCVFILKLQDTLPATQEKVPNLSRVYDFVTMTVAVSIVLSVFLMNLARTSHTILPHKLICSLLQSEIARRIYVVPDTTCETVSNEDVGEATSQPEEKSIANQYWTLIAGTADRIIFIIIILYFTVILLLYFIN